MKKNDTGYYTQHRPEMLSFLPKNPKRVLDVGCSEGGFGSLVKEKFDCEVWGLEPHALSAQKASEKLDKVIAKKIEEGIPELPDNSFDVIIFNDVLEHLVNPGEVLHNIRQKLSQHGCIVSSIPNVRFFHVLRKLVIEKDWKYEESGVLDKTHLRFFTKKSIIRLFEDHGYRIKKLKGINGIRFWKFLPFNILSLGHANDTRFLEFAVIAKKRD